jgi:nicotinamide-nucleotide amidase
MFLTLKSAIITIGDEILIGQVLNTNAAYLSTKLHALGITVDRMITVPDRKDDILKEFRYSFRNYDIVIVTGGLGPTHDDITKDCILKFFKSKAVLDRRTLANIKSIFRRRRISMPPANVTQAMIPDVSRALSNKIGTAPGILIERKEKMFAALPGVPSEMKYIFEHSLLSSLKQYIRHNRSANIIQFRTLHAIGIPESLLFEKIGNISEIESDEPGCKIKLAFLPGDFEVRIRVSVFAYSRAAARIALRSAIRKIKSRVGEYIYSYDESPLGKAVGSLLRERRLTLSVAESCTGGLIASKLTDVPGSSDYFLESFTVYSNQSKVRLLGVKAGTLKKFGAVSKQTAIEMAQGVRKLSRSDIGLSTTGIAGPSGGSKSKPVGLVWIGYADENYSIAKEFRFTKDRLRNKEMMSKMALEILRRKLLGLL